jgi:SAM-dependent methyltransferase
MTTTLKPRENYINGYDNRTLHFMRRRTLPVFGKFILPLLHDGQHLLDLGCGPGSMTLELAQRVAPKGSVIGVDRYKEQFPQGPFPKLNLAFCSMDAHHLEFEPETFDGVFSHALFEHLARPVDALRQAHRVLKKGGFIGLRSPDWGGVILYPDTKEIQKTLAVRLKLQNRRGGNVYAGRHLGPWLKEAGFTSVKVSASYEFYDDLSLIVDHLAAQMQEAGLPEHAAVWKDWGKKPGAMFAQTWFEAIGYKE